MLQTEQIELGRKIFSYMDNGETARAAEPFANPVRDYISLEQAAAERQKFFRDGPIIVALTGDLPRPGDFITNDLTGQPILVVRGKDGVVRAFLNVCRHRGAPLAGADVSGGCKRAGNAFVCPYHGWTYALDGSLVGVTESKWFGDIDKAQHGLRPLPVAEKYGFIWVRPGGGAAIDPDAVLGDMAPEMAAYGYEGYVHYETRTLRQAMNWKLVVGTFLEGYHLKFLHRNTVGPLLRGTNATFDGYGPNLRMALPRTTFDQLRQQPEDKWNVLTHLAIVYVLFPNIVLVWQGDHMETWRIYPAGNGADECVMHASLYIPEPVADDKMRRHWDRNMKLLLDTVEVEDFPLGENIQRGFHSGAQEHLLFGRNEPALAHYHRSIHQALGLAA